MVVLKVGGLFVTYDELMMNKCYKLVDAMYGGSSRVHFWYTFL